MNEQSIVVIDEDPAICAAIARSAGESGCLVRTFRSRHAAKKAVAESPPSLLIAALEPKEAPGEALRSIRQLFAACSVLLLSTSSHHRHFKATGAAVLVKPFLAEELCRTCETLEPLALH